MRGTNFTKTVRSRRLRRDSTTAELKLWNRVRSRALAGFKFVRQEPIGRYVVDFVCRERRLVIELDGGQHAESERDMLRDRWLAERRYRVLRFWNNDVISNIDGVLETIATALQAGTPPHPDRGVYPRARGTRDPRTIRPSGQARGRTSPRKRGEVNGPSMRACAIALPDLATSDGAIRWQTPTMRKPPS